ncbi:hypothetical protein BJV78DRAFT_1286980 [Lactifluus subvellereus]|nr:hypothetical protein BJV78DRAFT_1286980 [Lactifluus subvellereus]
MPILPTELTCLRVIPGTASGDYSIFNGKRIAVDCSALRPSCRRPFSVGAPPSMVPEFFKEVCPNPTIIDCKEIGGDALSTASAATIVQVWIDKFDRMEDRYVEIKEHSGQIFDLWRGLPCYSYP